MAILLSLIAAVVAAGAVYLLAKAVTHWTMQIIRMIGGDDG